MCIALTMCLQIKKDYSFTALLFFIDRAISDFIKRISLLKKNNRRYLLLFKSGTLNGNF